MLKFFKRKSANTASNFDKMETVGAKLTKMPKEQADYISVKPSGPFKPDTYRY